MMERGKPTPDSVRRGERRRTERSLIEDRLAFDITPESLLEANRSAESRNRISEYQTRRDSGELIVEEPCGDARPPEADPQQIVRVPSIAASGPIEPFLGIYQDPRVKGIILKPHFSKKRSKRGKTPVGCGGNDTKAAHMQNGIPAEEGDIDKYIKKNVPHADVVINSLYRAANLARLVDKPVLATAMAQDDAKNPISLLGWFRKTTSGSFEGITAIPLSLLFDSNYNPSEIYTDGIPTLSPNEAPDVFQERLRSYEKYVRYLDSTLSDYEQAQQVQNPRILIISTSTKGPAVRYASILSDPGSFFEIRVARQKIDDDNVNIDQESLRESLNQAHFPIARSVANHGDDAKDFSMLNRVLFEAPSMDIALDLAVESSQKPWMQDWMRIPNHRIMLARTRAGITEHIQYLT